MNVLVLTHAAALLLATGPAPTHAAGCGDMRAFRQEVLAIARADFPEAAFQAGPGDDQLKEGTRDWWLGNLQARVCALSGAERRAAIAGHLQRGLSLSRRPTVDQLEWAEAKEKVRLQLVPGDMADPFGALRRPLTTQVLIAVVLDGSEGYSYVHEADRVRWGVETDAVFARALENLERHGHFKLVTVPPPSDGGYGVVYVDPADGYEAAAILIPSLRAQLASALGDPFVAALPGRESAIFWSAEAPPDAQARMAQRTANHYRQSPHPLSPRPLRVWADGRVEPVP